MHLEAVVKLRDDDNRAPERGINLSDSIQPERRSPLDAALLEEQKETVGRAGY